MKTESQHVIENKYYIYKVHHQEEIIYIGKGIGKRFQHVLSGASHNSLLNEIYYSCKHLSTPFPEVFLEYCNSEEEALEKEHELIYTLKPKCNSQLKYTVPEGFFQEEFLVDDMDIVEDFDLDNY